jgi:hypothetical protein
MEGKQCNELLLTTLREIEIPGIFKVNEILLVIVATSD